jgi:hypothetical protein
LPDPELALVADVVADDVAELPVSLPSCVSIDCRSAENDCMKVDMLLVAASEPVLGMLLLELVAVAALEPAVA